MTTPALNDADFQTKVLGGIEAQQTASTKIVADIATVNGEINRLKSALNAESEARAAMQRGINSAHTRKAARPGEVGEDCARFFGAVYLRAALNQDKVEGAVQKDRAEGIIKDTLGDVHKAALTASDIPLPVEYQGDVVSLVNTWGAARRYCTVMPLGSGSVKRPRLKTDTTFGLIAGSASVTEKSPATEWVTFNAEKFGGLIRIPSEMDEDSIVSIGQFVAGYAARQIAYVEDYQCFRSTGAGSGLNGTAEGLTKSVVTNSKTTASTGLGSPSEFTLAHYRALRSVPDAAALRVGAYYMHPTFEQLLATFNTSGNRPYNPNAQLSNAGQPFANGPTLDGFPVIWLDVLPVYNTADVLSTVHVLFGDVSFQYLGVRGGIRFDTSREAGFTTDEVLIRVLERITTGLMATGAVGGLITHSA